MNPEIMERLLIDRSGSELNPDVAALLDAYLDCASESRVQAAQIEETLSLAKRALGAEVGAVLPSPRFRATQMGARMRCFADWRLPRWAFGLAAGFACGLVLGLIAWRGTKGPPMEGLTSKPPALSEKPAAGTTFWSEQRFRLHPPAVLMDDHSSLFWKSPVLEPEVKRPL